MRPLHFGLKSPKEKTPGPYSLLVTNSGSPFNILDKPSSRKGTLGKASRFGEYISLSKRTGAKVGPGTYRLAEVDQTRTSPRCKVKIKPNFSPSGTAASYMVGNLLVFDEIWSDLKGTLPSYKSRSKSSSRSSKQSRLKMKSVSSGRSKMLLNLPTERTEKSISFTHGQKLTER